MMLCRAYILDWMRSLLALLPMCSLANGSPWFSHNNACARCRRQTTPMEELVLQFYPGLFSPRPPSFIATDQESSTVNFVYSRSAEVLTPTIDAIQPDPTQDSNNSKQIHVKNDTRSHKSKHLWESSKELKLNNFDSFHNPVPSCCETIVEYITPPNVTIKGQVHRVVHLRNAFQFIPVAKCKPGTTCGYGECVERYRAHWVLIYNTTQPHTGPPVNFTPIEVPSHCECLNVGKP